ncbi:hypothetical protein KSW81_000069 [Nannochloris sp. 'desiccata']|nr:hypothetical protein KSW81_000069 [Chlorella desiccata (nom. nud.)]
MSDTSEISHSECSVDFKKSDCRSSNGSVVAPEPVAFCVSKWDTAVSRLTLLLLTLAYIYFWVYFSYAVAGSKSFMNLVFTLLAILLICDQIFHLWTQWVFPRMSRVAVSMKDSDFRIAMIVTKAPSEPHDLLVDTLKCMFDQDYQGKYDVWIADERPTPEMEAWCLENGVRISCRFGIEEYHRKDWPKRTRCKEGNLAYFYDKYGYENYDVVFQFDSDHAPTRTYLSSAIAGFTADPDVGYMAFPSINGASKSWAGKGRTWLEANYYGPFLSAFSYNPLDGEFLMPNCTGSHYAVRTSALKEIGGIGPELDEDLSTTIMFMSRGFKGVYSIDTIALGLGPETFESAMVQEFQWARSAIILFFRWFKVMIPNYKYFTPGLTLPAVLIAYGHYLMVRKRGWLRAGTLEDPPPPIFASPVVWLYRALRVVWMSRGVIAGFQELLFHKTPQFKVTPKGQNDVAVLSVANLLPLYTIYLTFGAAFWLPLIWKEPEQMGIALYMYICAAGTTCITIFVVFMHFWENGRADLGNALAHVVVLALLIAGLVVTSVLESRVIFNAAAGNLFIPVEVFPHEWIVMLIFYGISIFSQNEALNHDYLLILDIDNLLYNFSMPAGLPAPGQSYGGWEGPNVEVRGQFMGHYLSALAFAFKSTSNNDDAKHEFQTQSDALLQGLSKCQAAHSDGYLSAFPKEHSDR